MTWHSKGNQAKIKYILAMASLGAITGFLVGRSQSPVVGILLPLLFSLIGGGSGAFALGLNLDHVTGQSKLSILGWSIGSFSVVLLISLLISIETRTVSSVMEIDELNGFAEASTQSSYRAIEMRRKLEILGATKKEQKLILTKILQPVRRPKVDEQAIVTPKLEALLSRVEEVRMIFKNQNVVGLVTANGADKEHWLGQLNQLDVALLSSAFVFSNYLEKLQSGKEFNRPVLQQQFTRLLNSTESVVGGDTTTPISGLVAIRNKPELLHAIITLRQDLYENDFRSDLARDEQDVSIRSPAIFDSFGREQQKFLELLITGQQQTASGPIGNLIAKTPNSSVFGRYTM